MDEEGTVSETPRLMPGGCLIGITGGIACGKSEVGRILSEAGVAVRDTDAMAHEAIAPGGMAHDDVVARFGKAILREDGEVNRTALGERVFANPSEREALNAIVHPHVREAWRRWAQEMREENRVAAIIIPLLFEVGAESDVDAVLCVAASEDRVLERMARRGLTEEQARRRLAAQWPLAEKMRRADYSIENNDTMETLKQRTLRIVQTILNKEIDRHA